MEKNAVEMVAGLLLIVGELNWGLVGLGSLLNYGNLNVVNRILGSMASIESIVYVLVGLSALYMVYAMFMKK